MKIISNIYLGTLILCLLLLSSCECHVHKSGGSSNYVLSNLETVINSDAKIRNQIRLEQSGGLKVEAAFLMLETGELVPANNEINVGDRIRLFLKISGWEATDGKVQVGAGQQLKNSDQRVMMRSDDQFAKSSGFTLEDAQYISLTMEVLNTDTLYNYYQTDFKVWNKKASQHIYGRYRFAFKTKN